MKNSNKVQTGNVHKTPADYLKEPYARILTPDPEGRGYMAEILEFPGCVTQGDTPEEAYRNLEETAASWIESVLALNQEIPEPSISQGYAGKVALRLPRSLHRQAAQLAERDGTSLNQFLVTAISERVGATSLYTRMLDQLRQQIAQTKFPVFRMMVAVSTSTVLPFDVRMISPTTQTIPTPPGTFQPMLINPTKPNAA